MSFPELIITPQIPPFVLSDRHHATAPSSSIFATTASDFHLSSRRERDMKTRRRSNLFIETRSMDIDDDEHIDLRRLSRLRSNAFWELHRSVAENGEGLVRRMRDYEHSRSRTDAYLKVKEAQKRGRKRSSVAALSRRTNHLHTDSDDDQEDADDDADEEDDDIQIFAGEVPRISLPGNTYQKRALSLGVENTQYTTHRRRCSSPVATCDTIPSIYHSDDEQFLHSSSGTTSPIVSLHSLSPPLNPSLPDDMLSDHEHISLPAISLPTSPSLCNLTSSVSRTEKAIAALSLAMASGAGGITDYDALVTLQAWPSLDDCRVGEMWH
ncbi:hypothetical protein C0991_000071 [Blastosporella zonata]|nr:hypothetical protein C0991_000071 [Blastosporella zonata]